MTSTHSADLAGSVLGCGRMQCGTLQSKHATRLVKIMNSEFKSKVQEAEEMQTKGELPMLTGRQIGFMVYASNINNV